MHRRRSPAAFALRLLLLPPSACLATADQADPSTIVTASAVPAVPAVSAVSVYVPGYGADAWSELRGSVLASDSTATTYTIFCADSDAQHCQIAGDLPFVFAESPSTLSFGGADPDTITASLACDLEGTTAAACTGYSSFGAGYEQGPFTGPTETSWTSTMTGTEVEWGVLTLAAAAATAAASSAAGGATRTGDGTPSETPGPTDTAWFYPSATSGAATNATASGAAGGTLAGGARGWVWPAAAMLLAGVYIRGGR